MKRLLFILIVFCLSVSGFAQARLDYFLTEAAKCRMLNSWSEAYDLYSHCLEIDSCCAEATYQLGRINFYLRRDSLGMEYLQRAVDLDSSNTYYLEPLVAILMRNGQEEEALQLLERISQLQSSRSDVLSLLANLYSKTERLEDALHTLDRLELLEGKMGALSNEKFSLYMQLGDSARAFGELQSLCDQYPSDLSLRIDMGYCYQQLGYYDSALNIYEEVKQKDPTNTSLQMAMLEYYRMQGEDSIFVTLRDSILYDKKTDTDKKQYLLRQMITHSSSDSVSISEVVKRFEGALRTDSTNVQLLELYVSFLSYRNQPDTELKTVINRILSIEPDNDIASRWMFQYFATRNELDSLEEICRRGVNYHPEDLVYSYFLGSLLAQNKAYEEAVDVLNTGLEKMSAETRPSLISDVFTAIGDAYYHQNLKEEAFLNYDSALVYNRDNVLCLNNYAYFLSLEERDLHKAEAMAYRVIRSNPDNKTYLDTYAWILFMQGEYEEAQRYMEKVVPTDSSDSILLAGDETSSIILEHAGDIAWMLGNEQRALTLWRLAVERGDEASPMLAQKVKKRKYLPEKKKKENKR